jgi:hypothetical protein
MRSGSEIEKYVRGVMAHRFPEDFMEIRVGPQNVRAADEDQGSVRA